MKLTCGECNYQFETSKIEVPKLCQYCGRKDTLDEVKQAQDLIDDIA